MLKPFDLTSCDKAMIKNYLVSRIKTDKHNYWSDLECSEFKSRCKTYYIEEQDYHCCYCQQQMIVDHNRHWDLDHVVPKSLHPEFLFEPKNLAISCIDCNTAKGDTETLVNRSRKTYPKSSGDFKISHPHFDDYGHNILFIPGKVYIGLNKKGNETIKTCDLIRFSLSYLGWVKSISKDDIIKKKFEDYLAAKDENTKKIIMLEIQIILKIHT